MKSVFRRCSSSSGEIPQSDISDLASLSESSDSTETNEFDVVEEIQIPHLNELNPPPNRTCLS